MKHPPLRFQNVALLLVYMPLFWLILPFYPSSQELQYSLGMPWGCWSPTPQQALPRMAPALTAAVALLPFSTVAL